MDALTACELLCRFTPDQRDALLPAEFYLDLPGGRGDIWPACAAAAVALSGYLPGAEAEEDLRLGLKYFVWLWDEGIVTRDAWLIATAEVITAVAVWGEKHDTGFSPRPSLN
jgi:hypothetical protein